MAALLCAAVVSTVTKRSTRVLSGEILQLFEFMDVASDPGSVFVSAGWVLVLFMLLPHNGGGGGGDTQRTAERKRE